MLIQHNDMYFEREIVDIYSKITQILNILKSWNFKCQKIKIHLIIHFVKSVQIRSFFWSVSSCIQYEYRKIRTRKNSVFWHFSRTDTETCFVNAYLTYLGEQKFKLKFWNSSETLHTHFSTSNRISTLLSS